MKISSVALALVALSSKAGSSHGQDLLRGGDTATLVASDSGRGGSSLASMEARLMILETKHAALATLETKHAALETKHAALATKYAAIDSCIEMEADVKGGSTKVHIKDGCELVVHGHQTVHGHHNIKGGNLFISNGSGSYKCFNEDADGNDDGTPKCSGKGNIILGYHEDDYQAGHKTITGDHNIIIGQGHTVQSHGGIVSGVNHTATGPHASVIAGRSHTVSGDGAVILGGYANIATGDYSSVLGGHDNEAAGYTSTVSGGYENNSTGYYSSVLGGYDNEAAGRYSTVSGGYLNNSTADYSSVLGGVRNEAAGYYSSVLGGRDNEAAGWYSTVSGGLQNEAAGDYSSVLGGSDNEAAGEYSSVLGGFRNEAAGSYSTVSGGYLNNPTGKYSSVLGGSNNEAAGYMSTVSGGYSNWAKGYYSAISGGYDIFTAKSPEGNYVTARGNGSPSVLEDSLLAKEDAGPPDGNSKGKGTCSGARAGIGAGANGKRPEIPGNVTNPPDYFDCVKPARNETFPGPPPEKDFPIPSDHAKGAPTPGDEGVPGPDDEAPTPGVEGVPGPRPPAKFESDEDSDMKIEGKDE
ncbi:hypothetical protein ACHAXR_006458 [Thalassiosira sp. AJA248-18]